MRWKNSMPDLDGEVTENGKVVQLKQISGETGDDCPSSQYFQLPLIYGSAVHQSHTWNWKPSTTNAWPVMKQGSDVARKPTNCATSSLEPSPLRPIPFSELSALRP